MNNTETFLNTLEGHMRRLHAEGAYSWPLERIDHLMKAAQGLPAGRWTFDKEGPAVKATCKDLGIQPRTFKAIAAYCQGVS